MLHKYITFVGIVPKIMKKIVIEPLQKGLLFGAENVEIFKYLGLDVIPNNKYEIYEIKVTQDRSKQKHVDLTKAGLNSFRILIGHLLWASNQTCPVVSLSLRELSRSVKYVTSTYIISIRY